MPAAENAIASPVPLRRSKLLRFLLLGFTFTVAGALALASWYVGERILNAPETGVTPAAVTANAPSH